MLLERLPSKIHLKFQISDLKSLAEEVSRQLRAWAESLQKHPIKDQRYLTEESRRLECARKNREEMMKQLRRMQTGTGS